MKEIALTKGKFVIVDDDLYARFTEKRWNASPTHSGHFYAARAEKKSDGKYSTVFMHRIINNTPAGLHTDHINGNTLDNRRENLRSATHSQNQWNRSVTPGKASIYKGVCWRIYDKKWSAKIVVNNVAYHLGYFLTEEDAARAYDKRAEKEFGEFYRGPQL